MYQIFTEIKIIIIKSWYFHKLKWYLNLIGLSSPRLLALFIELSAGIADKIEAYILFAAADSYGFTWIGHGQVSPWHALLGLVAHWLRFQLWSKPFFLSPNWNLKICLARYSWILSLLLLSGSSTFGTILKRILKSLARYMILQSVPTKCWWFLIMLLKLRTLPRKLCTCAVYSIK